MAWNQRSFYTAPPLETHRVGQEDVRFAPVSIGLLFKLKVFVVPIAKLLTAVFQDTKKDNGTINRSFVSKDAPMIVLPDSTKTPASDTEFIIEPIKDSLAKLRHDQKVAAITEFLEKVSDDKSLATLAELCMDSMVDDFPRDKRNEWPPITEFLARTPVPFFIEMLIGVAKANKGRFGPLLASAGIDGEVLKQRVQEAVAETVGEKKTPPPTNNQEGTKTTG